MRFVSLLSGLFTKGRRSVSSSASVQESEVTDPVKLAEILRNALKRVSDLEAKANAEAIEFEIVTGTGGATTSLNHGFKGPVRWYVVLWTQLSGGSSVTVAPVLVQDNSSTTGTLVLRSYAVGRAVVRIESSPFQIGA